MKTAEDWIEQWDKRNVTPENIETHLTILRAIQIDALQEAARVAESHYHASRFESDVQVTSASYSQNETVLKISKSILSLANTLTNGGKGK